MNCDLRPNGGSDKKKIENRPQLKKMGVGLLQLVDPSSPKALKCNLTTHDYFIHVKNMVLGK